MEASQSPAAFVAPFANAAAGGYIRQIPAASQIGITNGAASLHDGFPPNCFVAVAAGGAPPAGQDFNGLLYQATAGLQWQQVGGQPVYNSAFSTAIGGYPNGAMLQSADGAGFWRSTVDNNGSDPDTGGANWLPMFFGTSASIALTNANVALSAVQYSKPIIVLTGTLTAPVALTFPAFSQQWTIINSTIGSYAVTALTGGGTAVTLAQGGKTELRGNGTNVAVDALQVGPAINALQAVNLGQFLSNISGSGYFTIPTMIGGDPVGLLVQYASVALTSGGSGLTAALFNLPVSFPTGGMFAMACFGGVAPPNFGSPSASVHSNSQVTVALQTNTAGSYAINYIAIGY